MLRQGVIIQIDRIGFHSIKIPIPLSVHSCRTVDRTSNKVS